MFKLDLMKMYFREYNMTVRIYDEDNHLLHPSTNILTKTTFGKQFDVLQVLALEFRHCT